MKTDILTPIESHYEAELFLRALILNAECYHPEENAHDIDFDFYQPTPNECDLLNARMREVHEFMRVDPCLFVMDFEKTLMELN